MRISRTAAVLGIGLLLQSGNTFGAFSTVPINLPTSAADAEAFGTHLSDDGDVAGNFAADVGTAVCGFRWSNGRPTLVTVPGCDGSVTVGGIAADGTIVGSGATPNRDVVAFTNDAAGTHVVTPPAGSYFTPVAATAAGQVVGLTPRHDPATGLDWTNGASLVNGRYTTIAVMAGVGTTFGVKPTAVNEAGTVAGFCLYGPSQTQVASAAFVWQNGKATILAGLGGGGDLATAINGAGQVVGRTLAPGGHDTAALWSADGHLTDLGRLSGDVDATAAAINDAGEVVDTSSAADHTSRAFLYADGVMTPLNALVPAADGLKLTAAEDVNGRGQVLAEGTEDGRFGLFLLTPTLSGLSATPINEVAPSSAAVPEPAGLAAVAVVGPLARRRRRRRSGDPGRLYSPGM